MQRRIVLLLLIAYGSCMKMRETVERTVMVRTTGSDLQPAATGYIYKKGTDGEAVVTKMGESEVMEHLSKLYEEPIKVFTAPIPISGPFSENESTKAELKTEDHVIPVEEKAEDPVDGIADEDYRKIFNEYASNFDEYLKELKNFKAFDGLGNKEYGFDVQHDYKDPLKGYHYGKQGEGDYETKKYESYRLSKTGDKIPYDNDYGKQFSHKEYKDGYAGFKGPKSDIGFQYKEDDEKDHKNDSLEDNHKYGDERKYYGGAGGENGHAFSSKHHDELGQGHEADEHDSTSRNSDEDSTTTTYGDYRTKRGLSLGDSYGFEITH